MKDIELRSKTMAALRVASIAAALLALAGAALPLPTKARTVTVLIDVSDSVGRDGVEASREAALSLIRGLEPGDRAAILAFAGKPALVTAPVPPQQAAALLESAPLTAPSPGSTDISSALAAATELAAKGLGSKSVYAFSDGRANSGRSIGESLAAVAAAVPSGTARTAGTAAQGGRIAINAIPEGRASADLLAEGLSVPDLAHPGERIQLRWSLASAKAREVEYRVIVDGEAISKGKASLAAGANDLALALDAGPSGRHSVIVEAMGPDGAPAEDSRAGAYLEVGGAADILVISGRASPIPAALRAQGMKVRAGGPESLPEDSAGYSGSQAVVLDNLPALSMTETQQVRLQDYVAGGGGLLVVGGDSSLGRGEYYATPLEDMLPVQTDYRQRLLFTRAKLLFVIDHSGSMSETVDGQTKQMVAMRGVAASIAELNPLDEVGIIGFDSSPTWVLPFTPASQKQKILASISNLGEGGGTDLANAVEEALKGFGDPGPTKRHAIILTDGLTPDADFKGLAARLTAAGVSVSTIGIGDEVNEELLKNLASWGGGRYYRASASQIPTIIDKETVRMTRELIQEGSIAARIAKSSPAVEGLGSPLPPLSGYLLTKAKDLATVLLEARAAGSSPGWDPLLSSWRYGNGTVAVFASDSGARWMSAWLGSPAYNRLWAQVVRSVERAGSEASLRASASMEGGSARVVVEAMGADRRSIPSLRLVGKASSGSGQGASFALEETAPGRYEGFVPISESGLASFEVLDPVTGDRASAWAWKAEGPESSRLGPDMAALSLIASSTGGKLLSSGALSPPKAASTWERRDLRLILLALAALLLTGELYLRSTMTGQIARAVQALLTWWEAQKAAAEASRAKRWPVFEAVHAEEAEKRQAEMQRRLAEHVARRYQAAEKQGEGNE